MNTWGFNSIRFRFETKPVNVKACNPRQEKPPVASTHTYVRLVKVRNSSLFPSVSSRLVLESLNLLTFNRRLREFSASLITSAYIYISRNKSSLYNYPNIIKVWFLILLLCNNNLCNNLVKFFVYWIVRFKNLFELNVFLIEPCVR